MKNRIFILCFFALLLSPLSRLTAQAAINTTGNLPDAKAMLDIQSTDKGVLVPRLLTATRAGIVAPIPEGLLVYDSDTHSFWQWNGIIWVEFGHTGLIYHSAKNALVMGDPSRAANQIGTNSVALGASIASGTGSTALGASTASAIYSTAIGQSFATGDNATAFGYVTTASGINSTALGVHTTTSGDYSTALGWYSEAHGGFSTAMGVRTLANSIHSTALGEFNDPIIAAPQTIDHWDPIEPLLIVGNGNSTYGRSNALVVFKSGNATLTGSLTQNSDRRLKHHITPLSNALDKVLKINGMNYYWKDTTTHDSRLQAGVIAQEVQAVMPELVTADHKGILSVNYQGITPYLIESIKILKNKNDDLQQQITELKQQNTALNNLKADVEALKAAWQTGVNKKEAPSVKTVESASTEHK